MVNASNLNIAHIGGKPVIIASKSSSQQGHQGQSLILQSGHTANGTNFLIGGQTLKMQGNVLSPVFSFFLYFNIFFLVLYNFHYF